jgi:predicted CopG family antitoxin
MTGNEYRFATKSKSLKDHVSELLNEGKRSSDEDFQILFRAFGEERIREIVKEIREERNKKKQGASS